MAQAGGGCLIEHSIHDVDILRFCFGEVDQVSARTANFAGHEGIEDLAAVTLELRVRVRGAAHQRVARHLEPGLHSARRGVLPGGHGVARQRVPGPAPHPDQREDTEVRPCPSPEWVDALPLADDEVGLAVRAYVEADRAFVDAVTAGSAPEPSLAEAVEAHRLVDAAYRSAAGGVPVLLG